MTWFWRYLNLAHNVRLSHVLISFLYLLVVNTNNDAFDATAGSGRIDMVIGVDVSGSVRRERLPNALDFITSVVDDLEVSADKTRVALVYFSDNAYQLFDFGQFDSKQDVMYWVKKTPYLGGRTNSAAALRLMVIFLLTVTPPLYLRL